MKRLPDIIILAIFSIHFLGNVLINIIGVPLAAYHSYEAWQEVETTNHSLQKQNTNIKTKQKTAHNTVDTILSTNNTHETKTKSNYH